MSRFVNKVNKKQEGRNKMKKLMIAAATVALAAGAFADVCGVTTPEKEVRQVYKWTFTGKTTKGLPGAVEKNDCGVTGTGCYARVPAKLKIKGWIAYCLGTCVAANDGTGAAEAFAFWSTKPYKADLGANAVLDFDGGDFPHVIGKKPNKAEAYGTFETQMVFPDNSSWDINFAFAGLGTYKAPVYKKIAGNFAGSPAASWYVGKDVCAQTSVYDCSALTLDCSAQPNTVAFGKWTMKYSKSASKKLVKGKFPKTASYAAAVQPTVN